MLLLPLILTSFEFLIEIDFFSLTTLATESLTFKGLRLGSLSLRAMEMSLLSELVDRLITIPLLVE